MIMKKNFLMAAVALVFGLGLQSCSNDDVVVEDVVTQQNVDVPEAVQELFEINFPTAESVVWSKKSDVYEATFSVETITHNAWFEKEGEWEMTRVGQNLGPRNNGLSQAILDYIAANYPGWQIDDVDLIRTPTDQYYEIELEKRGEPDVTIFIHADGTLINSFVEKTGTGSSEAVNSGSVPEAVVNAFNTRYPKALRTKWEREGQLYEAEFIMDNVQYEAYFQTNGTWVRTQSDVNLRTMTLPQAIQQYIATNHAGWTLDDADFIQTPTDEYYKIELEKRGSQDVTLLIRADGTLISTTNNNNNGGNHSGDDDLNTGAVPSAVASTFKAKYPTATRVEWEREGIYYKAEFTLNGSEHEAFFQSDGTWVRTEIELNMRTTTLPQAVQQYLATNYSGWTIDDAELIQTPTDEYYVLELEKRGQREVTLLIRADGTTPNR